MIENFKKYPEMIVDAVKRTENTNIPDYEFSKIIVSGVGGSAISGDLLKSLLRDKLQITIEVSRHYSLPAYADEKTLVFCISYSGNTEETLSQFVNAVEKKCKIITVTSGGKLKEWCNKLNIPCILVPEGYQPRSALPYLFIPLIVALQKFGVVNLKKEIDETINTLEEMKSHDVSEIVSALQDSIPVIYSSNEYSAVAQRMKTQFNENSKIPAKFDIFPELNHNEIVGYQDGDLNKNSFIIFLRDNEETQEIGTRIDISKDIIKDKVKGTHEIWVKGSSKLSKMLSSIFIGDILSYELAVSKGIDPVPVENINIVKKGLKEKVKLVNKLEERLGFN